MLALPPPPMSIKNNNNKNNNNNKRQEVNRMRACQRISHSQKNGEQEGLVRSSVIRRAQKAFRSSSRV